MQRLGREIDVGRVALLRQHHGPGHRHAELLRDRIVEELVVGRPPEWVVDDVGALEDRVLQVGAEVLHFVGDAVDNDGVAAGFSHLDSTQGDELGGDAGQPHGIDFLHEGGRKSLFHPEDDSNLLHTILQR